MWFLGRYLPLWLHRGIWMPGRWSGRVLGQMCKGCAPYRGAWIWARGIASSSCWVQSSQRYISNSLSWQHWCNINCFKQKGDNKTWQMKLCLRCSLVVVQRADICIEYFLYLRVSYLIFKCFFFLFLPNVTGVT